MTRFAIENSYVIANRLSKVQQEDYFHYKEELK